MTATNKTRDFFLWTGDEVELLLRVTQDYEAAKAAENVDWESSQSKYGDIFHWFQEQYPSPEEATTMGKDFQQRRR